MSVGLTAPITVPHHFHHLIVAVPFEPAAFGIQYEVQIHFLMSLSFIPYSG